MIQKYYCNFLLIFILKFADFLIEFINLFEFNIFSIIFYQFKEYLFNVI